MRTLTHVVYHESREQTFSLYHLTDLHLGARACAESLLRRDIQAIADNPNARWIYGGDGIDAIARKGDKRYHEATLAKWLRGKDDTLGMQRDYLLDMLKPIADKCLGMVKGNHEEAALKYYDRDIYWEIVTGMAAAAGKEPQELALGVQGFVNIKFRRGTPESYSSWSMSIYTHHGYGGGRLPGGHALTLGRVLGDIDCDLALLGHRHTRVFVDKVVVGANNRQQMKMAMFVPSYLDAYIIPSNDDRLTDTYAEEMGLPPQHLGTVPIIIKPDVRRMDAIFSSVAGIAA